MTNTNIAPLATSIKNLTDTTQDPDIASFRSTLTAFVEQEKPDQTKAQTKKEVDAAISKIQQIIKDLKGHSLTASQADNLTRGIVEQIAFIPGLSADSLTQLRMATQKERQEEDIVAKQEVETRTNYSVTPEIRTQNKDEKGGFSAFMEFMNKLTKRFTESWKRDKTPATAAPQLGTLHPDPTPGKGPATTKDKAVKTK